MQNAAPPLRQQTKPRNNDMVLRAQRRIIRRSVVGKETVAIAIGGTSAVDASLHEAVVFCTKYDSRTVKQNMAPPIRQQSKLRKNELAFRPRIGIIS